MGANNWNRIAQDRQRWVGLIPPAKDLLQGQLNLQKKLIFMRILNIYLTFSLFMIFKLCYSYFEISVLSLQFSVYNNIIF